jgi:hypothetical protein
MHVFSHSLTLPAVWMDTTSTTKAQRALDPFVLPNLSFISPNIPEMKAIAERVLSQQFALETVTEVRECVAQVRLAVCVCARACVCVCVCGYALSLSLSLSLSLLIARKKTP